MYVCAETRLIMVKAHKSKFREEFPLGKYFPLSVFVGAVAVQTVVHLRCVFALRIWHVWS